MDFLWGLSLLYIFVASPCVGTKHFQSLCRDQILPLFQNCHCHFCSLFFFLFLSFEKNKAVPCFSRGCKSSCAETQHIAVSSSSRELLAHIVSRLRAGEGRT